VLHPIFSIGTFATDGAMKVKQRDIAYGLLLSIVTVTAATLIRVIFLGPLGEAVAFLTFYPAVIIAALFGGIWAGLFSTALSSLAADYFLLNPVRKFALNDPGDILALTIFVLSCTGISIIIEIMRRSRADLIFHKENLEELVKMRTAELEKEITERKRAEEALQRHSEELAAANKELETFSYSVSHDLRAPLNAIRGLSDILMEDYSDKFNEDAKDLLKKITASTEKMSALINDILSLAKISRETMNCREIDLCPIAESVVNELRLAEPQRNIEIIIAAALSVFADAQLMRIALSNLIGNAWKYTGKNPSARIEIGAMTTENEHIFFVRDNGTGFPMSHAHKLFQPFQRLHSASQFPGTGIGLATVYKIILRHGGRIWAESEIDKGSTFYFTLKCKCRE
jgi:signal transduction histidine kinase